MEELLNKLIEKGWKPFGEWCHRSPYKRVGIHKNYNKERTYVLFYSDNHTHWKILRQVVSKESWLWQFVCKNGMVEIDYGKIWEYYSEEDNWWIYLRRLNWEDNYEYRLIESALCDEDKLEEFLLNSIKLD